MLARRVTAQAQHVVRHARLQHGRALCTSGRAYGDGVGMGMGTGMRSDTVVKVRVEAGAMEGVVGKALGVENMSRAERRGVRLREVVREMRRSDQDTGSPEVQIALWTVKIRDLTEHVTANRKDKENKRRLVMMVHKRRRMMRYLLRESPERYGDLVKALGLRPGIVFGRDVTRGAKKAATATLHLREG